MSEFWNEVTETLEEWGESVLNSIKSLFEKGSSAAAAALKAFVSSFAENVDDLLANAAKAAVQAVQDEKSKNEDATWSDYLSAAVSKIEEDLGDDVREYSKTALVSAAQAAYTQFKAETKEQQE